MVLARGPSQNAHRISLSIGRRGPVPGMNSLSPRDRFTTPPTLHAFANIRFFWIASALMLLLSVAFAAPVSAHHLMGMLKLSPSPLTGLLSGLAHPVLGPDHLLFLLALSLVGLRHRASWMQIGRAHV